MVILESTMDDLVNMDFRIFSSFDDKYKTIARIETSQMEKFGIKSGDILKIANHKTVYVICLPLEQKPNTPEMVFLNESKNIPQIFASNAIFSNLMLFAGSASMIQVSKTGLSIDSPKTSVASKVILATMSGHLTLGNDYQNKVDFSHFQGYLVAKNDRITAPLIEGKSEFSSVILDVKPEAEISVIGKNTTFEFQDSTAEVFRKNMPPQSGLKNLLDVVPIVKKIQVENDIVVTIPSLEIYENGAKLDIYITERLHETKEVNIPGDVKGYTMKQPVQKLNGIPRINLQIHDDIGNSYLMMPGGGSGSGCSFASDSDWEFYSTQEISYLMRQIDPNAKEATVVIKEMIWENHSYDLMMPPTKPPHMTMMDSNKIQLMIATGPWMFKIPLKQK